MGVKTLLTVDDIERMPDDDSVQIELDEGELIRMAPASLNHGGFEFEIARIIGNYVREHSLGWLFVGDTGFRLSDDTLRAPDIAFVRKERLAEIRGKGFAKGAPDLAVEIFSPSDSVAQLMRKVRQYLAAGCHTVWIVYPETRELQVIEASGKDRLLKESDTLDASGLLPGFSVRVADLLIEPGVE